MPHFSHPSTTLDQQPSDGRSTTSATGDENLCCYHNRTAQIQIIRMATEPHLPMNFQLERVVFPGQRLMFYGAAQAKLQVYTSQPVGAMLADTISCDRLRVMSLD